MGEVRSRDREADLQSGSVDLVVATYTMTEERKEQVDFAGPYFESHQDIMVRKDHSLINGADDLGGKKVCTVRGSASQVNLEKQVPEAVPVLKDRYSECAEDLARKQVDAVTTDAQILAGFVLQSRNAFEVLAAPFSYEPYGVGIRKGDELLRSFVNDRLKQIRTNGDWFQAGRSTLIGVDTELARPPEIQSRGRGSSLIVCGCHLHDDNRQSLAGFAAVLSGGFGIVLLAFSCREVRPERRFVLAALMAGAVLIGATAGFAILSSATKAAL